MTGARYLPRTSFAAAIAIGAATLLLMWPAFLNSFPFLYGDTGPYIRQGQQLLPIFRQLLVGIAPPDGVEITYLDLRLGFFGTFFYAIFRVGGMWAVTAGNAFATAVIVWLAARRVDMGARSYLGMVAVLAATTMAIEACFMMPDIWTAPGALAALLWLFPRADARATAPAPLNFVRGAVLLSLFFVFCAVHRTHMLLAAGLVAAAIPALLLLGLRLGGVIARVGPLAAMLVLAVSVTVAINHSFGSPLRGVPFLSARLLADGPGADYLQEACAADPDAWGLCALKDEPFADSEAFLWRPAPGTRGLPDASREQQIRMSDEDVHFALATLRSRPAATLASAAGNAARQTVTFGLDYDLSMLDVVWSLSSDRPWAAPFESQVRDSLAFRREFPFPVTDAITVLVVIAALAFLAWRLSRHDMRRAFGSRDGRERASLILFVGGVVFVLLLNAAICGALSGVFGRFQARVIWLLPLAAILVAYGSARAAAVRDAASA